MKNSHPLLTFLVHTLFAGATVFFLLVVGENVTQDPYSVRSKVILAIAIGLLTSAVWDIPDRNNLLSFGDYFHTLIGGFGLTTLSAFAFFGLLVGLSGNHWLALHAALLSALIGLVGGITYTYCARHPTPPRISPPSPQSPLNTTP